MTNTFFISYGTKVAQNKTITHMNFLEKKLMGPKVMFYKKISVRWKINVAHVSIHCENLALQNHYGTQH